MSTYATPRAWPWRIGNRLCGLLACMALYALASDTAPPAEPPLLPSTRDRLEMSSDRNPLPRNTALRVDVTRWLGSGSGGSLGLSLGMATQTSTSVPALAMTEPIWEPTLGVHWRAPLGGNMYLDLSTWTRAPYRSQTPDAMDMIWLNRQPNYGTRVEVQWASPRFGGLLPEFGAIGVKLEGDSQLLLRTRSGGPMLYYRTKF